VASARRNTERPQGLLWPTLGLILFLLSWLVACGSGFWFLYQSVAGQSTDPDVALRALQWMTWPFTVLVIAGPFLLILSVGGLRVVRDLLDIQKLVSGLPSQIGLMQEAVTEFQTLRTQLITDVSRVNDAADDDRAVEEPGTETVRPEVEEFRKLYESAKSIFYDALADYNTAAQEPLIVQRGGANFAEIAATLKERRAFDKSDDKNKRKAAFVTRVFEIERATRRNSRAGLSAANVHELRTLATGLT
jgi:hypothetical protein